MPALVPAISGHCRTFNQFNIVYLVSGGEPDNATDILISEAYRWALLASSILCGSLFGLDLSLLGWSVFDPLRQAIRDTMMKAIWRKIVPHLILLVASTVAIYPVACFEDFHRSEGWMRILIRYLNQ